MKTVLYDLLKCWFDMNDVESCKMKTFIRGTSSTAKSDSACDIQRIPFSDYHRGSAFVTRRQND